MKKISLITVVYNAADYIEQTILSVINQTYSNIEYIIIDGGSKDGTLELIKKYESKISIWKSENDDGIYHAMNKGINLASGEVIGFINADDFYFNDDCVSDIMQIFNSTETDICYGDCIQVSRKNVNKVIRYWKSGEFGVKDYSKGWYPPHPSFFVSKFLFNKFGIFDLSYTIASDVDLMLRFMSSTEKQICYLPKIIVKVRAGGLSNKNILNIIKLNVEIWNSLKKYQLNKSLKSYIFGKIFSRASQYLKLGT